jgi:hypothetical protein
LSEWANIAYKQLGGGNGGVSDWLVQTPFAFWVILWLGEKRTIDFLRCTNVWFSRARYAAETAPSIFQRLQNV